MVVMFLVIAALVLLGLLSYYDAADDIAEEEAERDNPCDTCLRWFECNGIDDECPLQKEREKNVH